MLSGLTALHSSNQRFVDLYPALLAKLMAILKACAATSAKERPGGGVGGEEGGNELTRTRGRQTRQQQQQQRVVQAGAGAAGGGVGAQGLGFRKEEEEGLSDQVCLLLTAACKALVDVFTR